jgi:hypothetical protein
VGRVGWRGEGVCWIMEGLGRGWMREVRRLRLFMWGF